VHLTTIWSDRDLADFYRTNNIPGSMRLYQVDCGHDQRILMTKNRVTGKMHVYLKHAQLLSRMFLILLVHYQSTGQQYLLRQRNLMI